MRAFLHRQCRRCAALGALVGACAATALAQPEPALGPALEHVPAGGQVLHCAMVQGVLYVTYTLDGRAAVAPAFHTPLIRQACAAAGHPVVASAPARTPLPGPRIGIATPVTGTAARPGRVVEPSFNAQSSGSSLSIDGRNDSDVAFHCVIQFAWTADGELGGSRGVSTQVTLAPRQSNRVVFLSGHSNMRFVGLPRWDCRPGG